VNIHGPFFGHIAPSRGGYISKCRPGVAAGLLVFVGSRSVRSTAVIPTATIRAARTSPARHSYARG